MGKEIQLTPEQSAAVEAALNDNTIVTAAAGSGKTFVLVERVIRLLCDRENGVPADRLAIMTFTKNATRSLHEKLNKALDKKMRDESLSAEDRAYCEEQKFKLRQANISTIDAFCLRLIKENPEAFGLPVTFTLADSAKRAALQTRAITLAMQAFYDETAPDVEYSFTKDERRELFYTFNFENDYALREEVVSFADELSTYVDAEKLLSDAETVYADESSLEKQYLDVFVSSLAPIMSRVKAGDPADKRNGRVFSLLDEYDRVIAAVTDEAETILSQANADLEDAQTAKERNAAKKAADAANKLLDEIIPDLEDYAALDKERFTALCPSYDDFAAAPSIETLGAFFAQVRKMPKIRALARSGKSTPSRKRFTALKNKLQSVADSLKNGSFDPRSAAPESSRIALKAFIKLVKIYREHFDFLKRSQSCIDFSDCELLLLEKLLKDEEYRAQVSARFSCVIVDEFQDSNDIQAEIFKQIAHGKLFYVGDIKQSIYAFRGGNPKIMAGLCKGGDDFKPLPLNSNFRSRKTVIDVVNSAFCGLMTEEYGGVEYDTDENRLRYGADFPNVPDSDKYRAEICLINGNPSKENKPFLQARFVARKIRDLHDDESFLITKETERDGEKVKTLVRPEYSDFLILLRTKSDIPAYRQALSELEISSAAPSGGGFLDSEEIKLALNYLEIVDNPLKDEQLLKVLMSPIYRFSADEVAEIRLGLSGLDKDALTDPQKKKLAAQMKKYSLFNCLRKCSVPLDLSEDIEGETGVVPRAVPPKISRFLSDLNGFRYFMSSNSLHKLVCRIYEDTDAELIAAAFEDSAQRVANIRRFRNMAADFEANSGGSLGDFLRFIERVRLNQSQKVEDASRPEDTANSVRIMTFHASKGLEAPICVLSDLDHTLAAYDYTGTLLTDRENYFALSNVDFKKRVKSKTFAYCALERIIRKRLCGEELRLMYVALTRAQEKLIMVGKGDLESWNETVLDPQAPEEVFESAVPFKWIYSSLLRYKIPDSGELNGLNCVITEEDYDGEPPQLDREEKESHTVSEEDVSSLCRKMNFRYAYEEDTVRREKYSVTDLAHRNSTMPVTLSIPGFAEDSEGISGADKGNAYHGCMQYISLEKFRAEDPSGYAELAESEITALTQSRRLTPKDAEVIEPHKIAEFFAGELGQRILKSVGVRREEQFYDEVSGKDIGEDDLGRILLQGRVDLYFEEDGELVVVDYKTDNPHNLEKEKENYARQVKIYGSVLPKITGMRVKEIYLYAFVTGEALKIQ